MTEIMNKCSKCAPYELDKISECAEEAEKCIYKSGLFSWDDKFGLTEKGKDYMEIKRTDCNGNGGDDWFEGTIAGELREEPKKCEECRCHTGNEARIIEGVGKDAEIITNAKGGKQSKAPMAMHLVDPEFLYDIFKDLAETLEYKDEGKSTQVDDEDRDKYSCYRAIYWIASFMREGFSGYLPYAIEELEADRVQATIKIAQVLQYGAGRYAPNNWRLIPQEDHINHALIHIMAHLAGDTQDDHINHALCRLMMAMATEKSKGFEYGVYVG